MKKEYINIKKSYRDRDREDRNNNIKFSPLNRNNKMNNNNFSPPNMQIDKR